MLIAAALLGAVIVGLAMMNSQTLMILRNQKQNTLAHTVLQQRMESLRTLGWVSLRDPAAIKATFENAAIRPSGLAVLAAAVESIAVEPYSIPGSSLPAPSGNAAYSLRRTDSSGTVTVSGSLLDDSVNAIRMTCLLEWNEGNRPRKLSHTILLTKAAHR